MQAPSVGDTHMQALWAWAHLHSDPTLDPNPEWHMQAPPGGDTQMQALWAWAQMSRGIGLIELWAAGGAENAQVTGTLRAWD